MPHVIAWNSRLLQPMKDAEDVTAIAKGAKLCRQIEIVKKDLQDGLTAEFNDTLHQIWVATANQFLGFLKKFSVPCIQLEVTIAKNDLNQTLSYCVPQASWMHQIFLNLMDEGRPLFIANMDFYGYFEPILTLGIEWVLRLKNDEEGVVECFQEVFERFTCQIQDPEMRQVRADIVLIFLENILKEDNFFADAAALFYMTKQDCLNEIFNSFSKEYVQAEELLDALKKRLKPEFLEKYERLT